MANYAKQTIITQVMIWVCCFCNLISSFLSLKLNILITTSPIILLPMKLYIYIYILVILDVYIYIYCIYNVIVHFCYFVLENYLQLVWFKFSIFMVKKSLKNYKRLFEPPNGYPMDISNLTKPKYYDRQFLFIHI